MLLHPLMLAWLAGAVVPLAVHLLSRSQYRAVPWGAMMFLTGSGTGARYSARLRQWTLLGLRMAMVGLLAVALARPVIGAGHAWIPTAGLTTGGPAAAVIILDGSAGMGYEKNGKTRLDLAREVTLQILSLLKRGDEAALLLTGTHEHQPLSPPSADLQSIAGRVIDLQPDIGQADFAADILKAADLLGRVNPADREIYLVCDQQAGGWRNVNDTFKQQWQSQEAAGPMPRLTIIPVGGEESDNIAVEGIDFPDHAAIRDQLGIAQVRVRNFGSAAAESVPLTVWTGTRTLHEGAVSIPARSTRTISVPVRFGDPGSRVVSAAVRSTGLTSDDRFDTAVDVLESLHMLVVVSDHDTATQPTTMPHDPPVNLPLARNHNGIGLLTSVNVEELTADLLNQNSEVILDDVARLSAEQMQALKAFIAGGGGVLILPGTTNTVDDYNQSLLGSTGILHVTLNRLISKPARLGSFDLQHAIFRYLPDGLAASNFPRLRYFPAIAHLPDARMVARFSTGEPAIIEATGSRGRVVLLTGIVEHRAGTTGNGPLPVLLQSILRYLATANAVDRNLRPGQPIVAATTQPVDDRSTSVQFVSGAGREPAVVTKRSDHTDIRYTSTNRPGTYRVRYKTAGKEVVLNYVVTASRAGSDLTPLTTEQWSEIESRIRFDKVDLARITVAQAIDTQRGGREIWIDLLAGVLMLMTTEMLLARWWADGNK